MIDIKSELLALKKKRKQDFISVIELLDFLKEHNSTTDYSEIATYLLIKLEPHDIRKTDDDLWGNEAFNVWESEHGIKTYLMPDSISDKPQAVDTSYFLTALEVVREDKNLLLFDDNAKAIDYLDEHQKNIFVDRKQIESILNINTLDEKALNNKYQNKITVAVGMALTKTDEFIKNTDINKSPVGLAERLVMQQQIAELQNRIAELEKENEQLKNSVLVKNVVDYDEYSIYGHSTPAIEAVFGTIKRFWVNADVTQPDTVANVDVIEEWIDENYSVSKTIKEAIQKITRPEKARSLGRKS
ncbi:TPA: hypothetical protein QB600_001467 [Pasteurella multocida]|nr:hypothetical protein [Pasteurella multocida]